ncbi:MAG: substrate-binding domain-containing protein [Synergistaceae bacterium]|jgi:ribose transport system substrate-binding protein|nr:substrate-binding domain-containing protein [Synergistaceae bacterium]
MKKTVRCWGILALILAACLLLTGFCAVSPAAEKKIKVAYAQAELINEWRVSNQKEMETKAEKYGVDFITTNAEQDPSKQLSDVQNLLAQHPDVLIVSPLESAALVPVVAMCDEAQVPLIIIDRTINAEPGVGMYKSEIAQSHEESGRLLAEKTIELLKAKYGEAKGSVVHVQGQAGASPVIDANRGWDAVMKDYPNIKTIATEDAGFTKEGGLRVMENFLQAYPKGQIDIVRTDYSDMTLGALEAIENAGRDELKGYLVGEGGYYKAIQEVVNGNIARETQTPPFFGDMAITTAIKIANGESVPARQPLDIKVFDSDKKEEAEAYIKEITANNSPF